MIICMNQYFMIYWIKLGFEGFYVIQHMFYDMFFVFCYVVLFCHSLRSPICRFSGGGGAAKWSGSTGMCWLTGSLGYCKEINGVSHLIRSGLPLQPSKASQPIASLPAMISRFFSPPGLGLR